ncbi:hypothetical protein [Tsuneonella sp. HG222]
MDQSNNTTRRGAFGVVAAGAMAPAAVAAQVAGPVVSAAQAGLTGRYGEDATQRLQDLFDSAPPGATIDFAAGMDEGGDYRVTRTLVIRKPLSLRGQNSRIVGVMGSAATDLLRYAPTAEMRGVVVEGLRLGFNGPGRDALVFDGGDIGVIGNLVSRCSIDGGNAGHAIRLAGRGNHFNSVRDCTLVGNSARDGAVLIESVDGNSLENNVISGQGAGVRLRLVPGSYKSSIVGGAIISRDMGVHIVAGQQVDIERVQFEQGRGNAGGDGNQARYPSHLVIEGSGRYPNGEEVRDIRIHACNFGSGSNQACAITLAGNARDILIDENYFNSIGTEKLDIAIRSASVVGTRIGPNNRVGGEREGVRRGQANALDPKDLFYVLDRGTGTYGSYKDGAALSLASGWQALPGFAFWKMAGDILHFRSALRAGAGAGELIGTLPPGFRPRSDIRLLVPTEGSETATLAVAPSGRITVRSAPQGATLYLDQIALPVNGGAEFVSGLY